MENPEKYRPSVGIMLLNQKGEVFVGKKTENIGTGRDFWQMPQGGIEDGEDLLVALKRELWEETGIHLEDTNILSRIDKWLHYDIPKEIVSTLWNGKYVGQKQKWFLLKANKEPKVDLNPKKENVSEFYTHSWIPKANLIDSAIWFRQDVYRQVLSSFSQYL